MVASLQEHYADLRGQIEHLRRELDTRNEELRRKDTILMMTQRIPELEATPETPRSSTAAEEGQGKGPVSKDQDESQRRSWWRRLLEG